MQEGSKNDACFGVHARALGQASGDSLAIFTEVVRLVHGGFPEMVRAQRAPLQRIGKNTQTGVTLQWYNEVRHPDGRRCLPGHWAGGWGFCEMGAQPFALLSDNLRHRALQRRMRGLTYATSDRIF